MTGVPETPLSVVINYYCYDRIAGEQLTTACHRKRDGSVSVLPIQNAVLKYNVIPLLQLHTIVLQCSRKKICFVYL